MTSLELTKHLMIELDKQGVGFGQAFTTSELDHFLNTAYLALIEQKILKMESSAENPGIRQKYSDDLAFLNILIHSGILNSATEYKVEGLNAFYIRPTYEPLHVHHISITNTSGRYSRICKRIDAKDRKPFVWNDLNAPYIEDPVFYMLTNDKELISGGTSDKAAFVVLIDPDMVGKSLSIKIYGLKRPELIDTKNSPNHKIEAPWWNEIVRAAATYGLENIESGRTQIHSALNQQSIP